MSKPDMDDAMRRQLREILLGKNVGMTPGQMLQSTREGLGISRDAFASFVNAAPEFIDDIENNRVPFPTMYLSCIFVFGLDAWYHCNK